MACRFEESLPVSVQLVQKLRSDILNGKYPPGGQFPTVRELACQVSVNPNTVQKALGILEQEGLLVGHGTVGRSVTSDTAVLENKRVEMQKSYLREMLAGAKALGISVDTLLRFIKESEEHT